MMGDLDPQAQQADSTIELLRSAGHLEAAALLAGRGGGTGTGPGLRPAAGRIRTKQPKNVTSPACIVTVRHTARREA